MSGPGFVGKGWLLSGRLLLRILPMLVMPGLELFVSGVLLSLCLPLLLRNLSVFFFFDFGLDFVLIWCPLLHFSSVIPISRLVVLGLWLIPPGLVRNSERPGFPTFAALDKGIPSLRNPIVKSMGGYHFYLRLICLV